MGLVFSLSVLLPQKGFSLNHWSMGSLIWALLPQNLQTNFCP